VWQETEGSDGTSVLEFPAWPVAYLVSETASPIPTGKPKVTKLRSGRRAELLRETEEHPRGSCMKRVVLALMVTATLGGCSSGSSQEPSDGFSRETECARNGGRWKPGEGAYAFCQRGGGV
jgi:hypothetical protein